MFSAVRKRTTARQEAARVPVLNDPDRPRPFKPEWLLAADELAPIVTRVAAPTAHKRPAHVARRPVIDDVEVDIDGDIDGAYPKWKGANRFDRRARRFSSRSARRAAFRARTAMSDVEKAANEHDARVAGSRGRLVDIDGELVYTDVVAPLSADTLTRRYGPKPTPAQARRIRKAANRALA